MILSDSHLSIIYLFKMLHGSLMPSQLSHSPFGFFDFRLQAATAVSRAQTRITLIQIIFLWNEEYRRKGEIDDIYVSPTGLLKVEKMLCEVVNFSIFKGHVLN